MLNPLTFNVSPEGLVEVYPLLSACFTSNVHSLPTLPAFTLFFRTFIAPVYLLDNDNLRTSSPELHESVDVCVLERPQQDNYHRSFRTFKLNLPLPVRLKRQRIKIDGESRIRMVVLYRANPTAKCLLIFRNRACIGRGQSEAILEAGVELSDRSQW